MIQPFSDRIAAGRALAARLEDLRGRRDVVVLGLARGGVPVAYEVARELHLALDVFLVRKLGVPGHEELAMGAIAARGARVLNDGIIASLGIGADAIEAAATRELRRIEQQEALYRGGAPALELTDRCAVLVDDGIATGATMAAAVAAARAQGVAQAIVATPVGAIEALDRLEDLADRVEFALTPEPFLAVGAWYRDFAPTEDAEVAELLRRHGLEAESTPRYRPEPVT